MQRNRIFWPPRGRVKPGTPDLNPLGTPPGLFLPTNGSHAKRAFRYLPGTRRKAPPFFERAWHRFLVRYSCSSSCSSPRPSLILLVLPYIRALFVRMFVPPGPRGGYLGCILGRLGGLLGRLEVVLRPSWNSLERSWDVSEPLGPS